jgi:hypothetical protein
MQSFVLSDVHVGYYVGFDVGGSQWEYWGFRHSERYSLGREKLAPNTFMDNFHYRGIHVSELPAWTVDLTELLTSALSIQDDFVWVQPMIRRPLGTVENERGGNGTCSQSKADNRFDEHCSGSEYRQG